MTDGEPPPQATPWPGLVAGARAAAARAAPLGPHRARSRRLRRVLRARLLLRLEWGRCGRAPGRGAALPVRRHGLCGADRPLLLGHPDRDPADAAGDASAQGGSDLPRRGAHSRPRGRLAGPRARPYAARGLARPLLPQGARRPRRRVAPVGVGQVLLRRRLAHPVHLPAGGRSAAPHRRVDRRGPHRHALRGAHHRRARAPHRDRHQPAHGAGRPAAGHPSRARGGAGGAARARGPGAGGARHPRGGAGARRLRPLPGPVRGRRTSRTPTRTSPSPRRSSSSRRTRSRPRRSSSPPSR